MQSVIAIVSAIEKGEMLPREAVAASLDAIAAREAEIGAFEALGDRETLLAAAEGATGPLAGIAVGIKDIFDTHDLPTGYGSPIHAGFRPPADAASVAMLRRAGATVVGKTVTTEFAFFHPGRTRNPHDLAHTPGGSSSGSAAAIAAGMIPAATGTQTGGSVIRPAAYCGVAGYKPSFRLVPATGMKTFSWTLDTVGYLAAGVADVAALAAAATGRPLACLPVEPASLRIGLFRSADWDEASEPMREALLALAARAERAGATVLETAEPDELRAGREAHATIQNFEAALSLADEFDRHASRMSARLVETLEAGRGITPEQYDRARRAARAARRRMRLVFDDVNILIAPSAPGAAPRGLETTGVPTFNKLWTLTGNPCVNVPGGVDDAGLPLGLQAIARFGDDRTALSAAAWLESLG